MEVGKRVSRLGGVMMADRVVILSIPQLRHKDVTPGALASLDALAARGALADLVPPFPGLAASSFASLMTGTGPHEHGLIGDTYFDRDAGRVVAAPLPDSAVEAPRIWDRLGRARPGAKTLAWFAPNSRGVAVQVAAYLGPGGDLRVEPPDRAADLLARFGEYPRSASGAEPPRLEATDYLLKTACAAIAAEGPDLAIVRVPYLGQIARRFGPDGRESGRALRELEPALAAFLNGLPDETLVLAVTESISTPVSGPIYPNRILRGLGLLALTQVGDVMDVDLAGSAAFALADHQLAQVYVNDPGQAATVASAFAGDHGEGIAVVAAGGRRAALGLDHARAGDVVLVATPDRWFAPDWWESPAESPQDGGVLGPSIDPATVKGSLGSPSPGGSYLGVVVSSRREALGPASQLTARDVAGIALAALGVPATADRPAISLE